MIGPSYGASMANPNLQQLLVDTDAYCKLSVAGLFTDATTLLGVPVQACGRLVALPYMLRRGGLRRMLGDDTSDALAIFAERIPLAVRPHDSWLDPLTSVASIDPGEAQLLAASAERGLLLLTGDKRGLHGVKDIPGYAEALDGHVVVLEAILIELCLQLGVNSIRSRIQPMVEVDIVTRLCFAEANPSPLVGLVSYYQNLTDNLRPLNLWRPSSPGGT